MHLFCRKRRTEKNTPGQFPQFPFPSRKLSMRTFVKTWSKWSSSWILGGLNGPTRGDGKGNFRWSFESGQPTKTSWWFQPSSNNISQNGNLPQVGVKIKHIWNHHLEKNKLVAPKRWKKTHTHTTDLFMFGWQDLFLFLDVFSTQVLALGVGLDSWYVESTYFDFSQKHMENTWTFQEGSTKWCSYRVSMNHPLG